MSTSEPAPFPLRASAPYDKQAFELGPLIDLPGTWVGSGFNLISLPQFDPIHPDSRQVFRVQFNITRETLEFTPIGGRIPNRGSTGQQDLELFGVSYHQRVSDALNNQALHVEPGLWLKVPKTVIPPMPEMVIRQGAIPHGDSLLAQGTFNTKKGGPDIKSVTSIPTQNPPDPDHPFDRDYLSHFDHPQVPSGFNRVYVKDMNLALKEAIKDQTIVQTTTLQISTSASDDVPIGGGGILNIPFLQKNATATRLDATFWIETVQQKDGSLFLQLQYSQKVILNFLNIDWPHISVATLIKQ